MERVLIECAIRAVMIAAAVGTAIRLLRVDTAAARHTAWTVAVVAMLLLPPSTMWGPKTTLPVRPMPAVQVLAPQPSPAAAPVTSAPVPPADAMATATALTPPALRRTVASWRAVVWSVYWCGALLLLGRLVLGTWRTWRLRRGAIASAGHLTSAACVTPLTVGWLRPVTILPLHWDRWPEAQLQAVLAHEQEHVRRRDPLVQWLALLNRAVFWFHPLAWWLERRLALLAEEACDSAVLRRGHRPADYLECLLAMARLVMNAGGRVKFVGAAMPGASLSPRIRRILQANPDVPISRRRLAGLVTFCGLSSLLLTAATLEPAPPRPGPAMHLQQPPRGAGQQLAEYWFDEDEWHLEVAPLMSVEESDAYRRLRTTADRTAFIAAFWNRRDPTPATAVNEFREAFERRIAHAKERLSDPESAATFGYQTDRGRWYVQFGPPDTIVPGPGAIEEWRYGFLAAIGRAVVVRFDPESALGCSYRGGRYRIVSPPPSRRFDGRGGDDASGSRPGPAALTYPGGFVYLSFPIDTRAAELRWELRPRREAGEREADAPGPVDYVQGTIGAPGGRPILTLLGGMRPFEPGSFACTEHLPAGAYTLRVDTTLVSGDVRRETVTFEMD